MGSERQSERRDTDKRLKHERRKTDQRLEEKQRQSAKRSDAVLKATRLESDATIARSRAQEDRRTRGSDTRASRARLERERRDTDSALARRRAEEDKSLGDERVERRKLFADLLDEHRARTDDALKIERNRADARMASHDTLLGIVSHDVRQVAVAISLSGELMLKRLDQPRRVGDDSRKDIERIQRAAERIRALVGDLIDVAAIGAGQLAVHPTSVDLRALVQDALDTIAPLAAEKGMRFRYPGKRPALRALIDERRILQVLANLLGNAIKFSDKGSEIRVELERAGEVVRCSVTDFGIGIEAASVDAIFQRFRRENRRDVAGAGLGLYIARAIVEAHGGRIWVDSKVAVGSTFHFTLPAAD